LVKRPTHIKPSAQVVWPIVGEILNGDVGGGFKVNYFWVLSIMARKWYYKRTSTLLNCDWWFSNGSSYVFCWLVPLPQKCTKT
jgi:hypothetical protein